jgi:hypothetical protein
VASRGLPAASLALLLIGGALAGCGPVSSVDRVSPRFDGGGDTDGGSGGSGGSAGSGGSGGSTGGAGGAGGTGGTSGAGGAGGGVAGSGGAGGRGGSGGSVSIDTAPDVEEPPDMLVIDEPLPPPPDMEPVPRTAVLVVGDPNAPLLGDLRLKAMLEAKAFIVSYADDSASSSVANGATVVVLSSSSSATELAARYKNVTAPVLVMESHVFDDMKMTGPVKATDYDEEDGRRVDIIAGKDTDPLAAYYSGSVTVSAGGPTGCCGINWGRPAASANKVANYMGQANRCTIFAYEKAAVMVDGFAAPARRVGFFAAETTVQQMTADGLKLFNAALTWVAP